MSDKYDAQARELLARLDSLNDELTAKTPKLRKDAIAYYRAALGLATSWSGVPLGYLSKLYFGNFEQPDKPAEINPMIGGNEGLNSKWQAKGPNEVVAEMIHRSKVDVRKLMSETDELVSSTKQLQTDILVKFSWICDSEGNTSLKTLLADIETFKFDTSQQEKSFVRMNMPTFSTTMDMKALSQGRETPPHVQMVSVAFGYQKMLDLIRDFVDQARRFLRQIREKPLLVEPSPVLFEPLTTAILLCRRFGEVALQLANRQRSRAPFEIKDEYDVQGLLHVVLRIHFDDVRNEEYTPSYASKSTRMDFLLKSEKIVLEAKITSSNNRAKEIGEQLAIDAAFYKQHPDCKTLVCLIHDPQRLIANPAGLETDMALLSTPDMRVYALVTR